MAGVGRLLPVDDQNIDVLGFEHERRVASVSGETESEGRIPRQLTELPHFTDRSRDEVSRAVSQFAEQHVFGRANCRK